MNVGPLFALFAANALAEAPSPHETISLVEAVLAELDRDSRPIASRLILLLDQRRDRLVAWLQAADPVLRLTAGRVVGKRWAAKTGERDLLDAALLSPDAGVRSHAEQALVDDGGTVPEDLVQKMQHAPAAGWQCRRCGTQNEAVSESCKKCHIVGSAKIHRPPEAAS
jgi:hypothetical protein